MSDKRLLPLFLLVLAVFFLIANRGAYKGYFQDDDLDNLAFTRELGLSEFLTPLVYPRVYTNNFRPVGHLFYRWMGATAGLHYDAYIALLHAVHLLNVLLLWLALRRLGLPRLGTYAGALLFAFHMAAFDVFWKPMYVFDLLCALFCLLSLLAYLDGRWIVSLLAMFVAYRSKEVAITLPVVFAAYEFLLGQKRWKRLIPFFALSLIIGVQALVQNQYRPESDYKLHLDPASIWTCMRFYSSRVFLLPYAGFLLVALLIFFRDKRFVFGVVSFCALLTPMLLVPGRLASPYLYVALLGLAIAGGAVAATQKPVVIAIFFALWLPWNYVNMRKQRNETLADARDRRTFVRELFDFNRFNPKIVSYIYNQAPVNAYGSHAVIKLAHPVAEPVGFITLEDPGLQTVLQTKLLAILSWDAQIHHLRMLVRTPETRDLPYLKMSEETPIWQLEDGWYGYEDGGFRWTNVEARARLSRPAEARNFEFAVNISPLQLEKIQRSRATVRLNGDVIGECEFTHPGWQTVRWALPPAVAGPAEVAIQVSTPFRVGRMLGIAVGGFGFVGDSHATQ